MRIGRVITTPAILLLGTAGWIVTASAMPVVAAASAANVHVIATSATSSTHLPDVYFHT